MLDALAVGSMVTLLSLLVGIISLTPARNGVAGMALLALALAAWRHRERYAQLASVSLEVNDVWLANSLRKLGRYKCVHEAAWFGLFGFMWLTSNDRELGCFGFIVGFIGLIGYAIGWIWSTHAHANLHRSIQKHVLSSA